MSLNSSLVKQGTESKSQERTLYVYILEAPVHLLYGDKECYLFTEKSNETYQVV